MFRKPVTPLIIGVLLTGSPPVLWAGPRRTAQTPPDVAVSEILLTAASNDR